MTLLFAEGLSKRFAEVPIFDKISFTINSSDRIALVGKNGSGKTTLLEILSGKQGADEGEVTFAKSCIVDYVEQEKGEYLDFSLFDFVADARRDLLAMRRQIQGLESRLADDPHDDSALEKLGALQHRFEVDGGFDFENEISTILVGLGFDKERYKEELRNFSGGEKNRAGLARVLAGKGNLLLLDEPTNHLDIESTLWLEQYLSQLDKACLLVSHDRTFLNSVTKKVWELHHLKLETYIGGFEQYLNERSERRRLAEHRYRHQQEEIKRIEDFVQRNMAGQKTKQAQSRLKYLGRIKRLPPPPKDSSGPSLAMKSSGRSWSHILSVDSVKLGYGKRTVLEDVTFDLYRGEKLGLVGRNGSGKSTILKALIGELDPIDGSVSLGNNVDVAYFDQELDDLDGNLSVLDCLWKLDPSAEARTIRSYLGRFGFSGEDHHKIVGSLSGGEKTKLSLSRLLYRPANLIILDEPTNHLDIYARESLETALLEYDGSCLIVSHDRYLLAKVTDRILYVNDGCAKMFDHGYEEFESKVMADKVVTKKVTDSQSKRHYHESKDKARAKARIKQQREAALKKIKKNEAELILIEEQLHNGIPKSDWEKLNEASERKQILENEILELYERLEGLGSDDV